MALHVAEGALPVAPATALPVEVAFAGHPATVTLAPSQEHATWNAPAPVATGDVLAIRGPDGVDPTLHVEATVHYGLDALAVPAQAVGLRLERHYAVLRDNAWVPVTDGTFRAGDWVRVTLTVSAPAWRHFVAVSDPVPGGLAARDIRLAGVGTAALGQLGDTGAGWFDHRQTDPETMRLYATALPPGTHEVHWYAQAVHAGDFLAPAAVAELMYGRGSRATTKGERVRVVAGP
jgi:uncharacterized protein YfaS (alpha-2-macroglobulin family)